MGELACKTGGSKGDLKFKAECSGEYVCTLGILFAP